MTRKLLSSSTFTVVGLLACAPPVSLSAQGARARGSAVTQGQAVPRGGTERAAQGQAPPQRAESQRAEPSVGQASPTRVPPSRRVELPSAPAVPRPVPQVLAPPAARVVQPQVGRPQIETLHPNDHLAYRPGYRPNYRPSYRPAYGVPYRPYYSFRPRFHLAFGLWVGYPVTFPTYFYPATPYPYVYTSPYPNTYPYPTGIYPAPETTAPAGAPGGLSFDIRPAEAGVYVDGYYMGTVAQFSPNEPPLALAPGRHHVEIREPGFETIAFDVDILPGQVIPYEGDLRRF